MGKFDAVSIQPGDFGNSASTHTILTAPQLESMFTDDAERASFKELLKIVDKASTDNNSKAAFIRQLGSYGETIFKLLHVIIP